MTDCKSCSTLIDTQEKLSEARRPMLGPMDSTAYRSLASVL
jgi:hypothetical protein